MAKLHLLLQGDFLFVLKFCKFCPTRPERAEAPSPGRALKKSLYGLC